MYQRNVVAQGWLRRYLLRRDLLRKVAARWKARVRLNTKDAFADQRRLLEGLDTRVIVDGGANIGVVTQAYARLFPAAEIYALEASPQTYPLLASNFRAAPKVHPVHAAISDVDGELPFNVNFNPGTSSLLTPSSYNRATWAAAGTAAQVLVPVLTIPTLCSRFGIERIDILKLDVEGAELAALRGSVALLQRSAIRIVYLEACLVPLYESQPLLHHLTQFLGDHGYTLYNLYQIVESTIGQGTITNATFLSPELRAHLQRRWGTAHCGW
jgi:FkbM family methyltransferase